MKGDLASRFIGGQRHCHHFRPRRNQVNIRTEMMFAGHAGITANGDLVSLEQGELIIVVDAESFVTTSIRVETGQFIKTILLESFGIAPTFTKVWP